MEFKLIEPHTFPVLSPYFRHQPYELCEFSLATLTVWANAEYRPQAAVDNSTLYIKGTFAKRRDLNHLMLPLSGSEEFPPERLRSLAEELGMKSFWFIPDCYIARYGKKRVADLFDIEEQTAYTDYVYLQEDLAQLRGNRYAKKRNLISQFLKNHPPELLQLEDISGSNAGSCLEFLEEWCSTRECNEDLEDSLTCERLAAEKMLNNIEIIGSKGILLRIRGKISAFGICSYLTDSMGILQFEKAFENIKGLYQFFDRECIRRLFSEYQYVNKESDMEVPGLAKSKKSYHPVKRIHSYQLNLRE